MSIDMFPDSFIEYALNQEDPVASKNNCKNCGNEIKTAIFKGGEWCSDDCRKQLSGETSKPGAQTDAGITNLLQQPTGEVNLRGIR